MKIHTFRLLAATLVRAGATIAVALTTTAASASSHRDAPWIANHPAVDATDLYMFRSYEAGRSAYVTILANYTPFQIFEGGGSFYMFDPNALYEIHIDNTGAGTEAMTFQFHFANKSTGLAIPVNGKSVEIPLLTGGPISGVAPATLGINETYTLDIVRGDRRTGHRASVTNAAGGANPAVFTKPVDFIGKKSFGSAAGYDAYANQYIYNVNIPGCSAQGKVFVGQRKDPFYVAVGPIVDLLDVNLLGPEIGGNNNDQESNNISTLALEVPIACLTAGTDPVIGAWTTASLRQATLLSNAPATGLNKVSIEGGPWTQVSRLGNPLITTLLIGTDDKDKFNSAKPKDDGTNFAKYVTNPTAPTLIQALNPALLAPTNFPRTDLVAAYLKGIKGLNQPANVAVPAEMLRLNTSIAPVAIGAQNALGFTGGDRAGFPNGRRPGDDVVDLTLRIAMGALCVKTSATDTLKVGCKPSDAPTGSLPYTDGVRKTSVNFGPTFPYLTTPISGALNQPADAGTTYP